MAENFVTMEEAAELENIEYHTFVMRSQRSSDYKQIKEIDNENGGRERVFIAVSSLSSEARKLYRKKQKIIDTKLQNDEDNTPWSDNAPWYVHTDWAWYREEYSEYYHKGLNMARHVEDCLRYEGNKDKTKFVEQRAAKLGMGARTFQTKIGNYSEAAAWALEMNKKDNGNYEYFKILSLCQKPRAETGRTSLNDEMRAMIENIWFEPMFAMNQCKYTKLYDKFVEAALKKGYRQESLPSRMTVIRYIKDVRTGTDSARVYLAKGAREFKRTEMVKRYRDNKSLKVMELVVGDTHTFDCFVSVTDRNGQRRIVKPCLVGFIDMKSRSLVGWGVCEIPNSQIIKEVLINMVMEKTNKDNPYHGVPRVLLIDNGKDYTAESLTGRPRTVRVDLDSEFLGLPKEIGIEQRTGFYSELGIEEDKRSLPYQPWTKAQIERFFGTVCEGFTRDMDSYVGTLTGSRTSAKIVKDIKELDKQGKLMDIHEFASKFEYWNLNIYSKREHRGLKKQKEFFKTPYDVYCHEDRYYKAAPPKGYLEQIAMVRVERKIYATGISLFDCSYMCEALQPYINNGKKYIVRYNPNYAGLINVYEPDSGKFMCQAQNMKMLNPLAETTSKELENHMRDQRRQTTNAKGIIAYGQMTYEERIDNKNIAVSQKALVLPELQADSKQKVVSIPKNTNYLPEKKAIEDSKKERLPIRPYIQKLYEEEMAEMRLAGGR